MILKPYWIIPARCNNDRTIILSFEERIKKIIKTDVSDFDFYRRQIISTNIKIGSNTSKENLIM